MKQVLLALFLSCFATLSAQAQLPSTAELKDSHGDVAVYTNVEEVIREEYIVYSVWYVNKQTGMVRKLCTTNPMAEGQWERMQKNNGNGVTVGIDQIAAADKAYIFPGYVNKVVVEGCPDNRNIWTYIIDVNTLTAMQISATEGVQECDWDRKEIIVSSYGYYEEGGRYTYKKAIDVNGRFLRQVGERERE